MAFLGLAGEGEYKEIIVANKNHDYLPYAEYLLYKATSPGVSVSSVNPQSNLMGLVL